MRPGVRLRAAARATAARVVAVRVVARSAVRRWKRVAVARAAVIGSGGDGGVGGGVSGGVGGGVGRRLGRRRRAEAARAEAWVRGVYL